MTSRFRFAGVSLLEVIIAFGILLVAVLTMFGYVATIHRAASESKHQALASMEARALVERIRDFPPMFLQAATDPAGYTETRQEYLLEGEVDARDNEVGRQGATQYELVGRAAHVREDIYRLTVRASWEEEGRVRQVVLETRMVRPRH